MQFWKLTQEVPAEIGDNSVMDTTVHPPLVTRLHLSFVGWLGSELIECFPVYATTRALSEDLKRNHLTGFGTADLEVTVDDQFHELYPGRTLPEFVWLKISGTAGKDDFGMDGDLKLVVSERALVVVRSRTLAGCVVERA